jgi:hypothetical protein
LSFQPAFDFTEKQSLPPAVQERIAEGMQQADENADGRWKHIWDGCVLAVARCMAELTADDVRREFEKLYKPPHTHNLAAIGPAMRRACKMGILSRTDRVIRSHIPGEHGNRHNIWISNYFGAESGNPYERSANG